MIKYLHGDLFDSRADALAHGCNVRGKMRAGVANEFRVRFPEMYEDFRWRCRRDLFPLGSGYVYYNEEKPHVINLATQAQEGATLELLESAFRWLAQAEFDEPIKRVAMPRIGCGLGGLEWREVRSLLEDCLLCSRLTIEVWAPGK